MHHTAADKPTPQPASRGDGPILIGIGFALFLFSVVYGVTAGAPIVVYESGPITAYQPPENHADILFRCTIMEMLSGILIIAGILRITRLPWSVVAFVVCWLGIPAIIARGYMDGLW